MPERVVLELIEADYTLDRDNVFVSLTSPSLRSSTGHGTRARRCRCTSRRSARRRRPPRRRLLLLRRPLRPMGKREVECRLLHLAATARARFRGRGGTRVSGCDAGMMTRHAAARPDTTKTSAARCRPPIPSAIEAHIPIRHLRCMRSRVRVRVCRDSVGRRRPRRRKTIASMQTIFRRASAGRRCCESGKAEIRGNQGALAAAPTKKSSACTRTPPPARRERP